MQRVKILGGRLGSEQWSVLGLLAERFTPATPLHLTTRQEIEFHDLRPEQIIPLQAAIDAAGLTGLGACGDTPRNITVEPASGAATGTVDLVPLAWDIRRMLEAVDGIFALPRKFKISLSATAECAAQPWINDLGFIAEKKAGRWGFRVIGAGSLGSRPALGVELFECIEPCEVVPLALAAIRLFDAHGDRENRNKARLRHVRQRIGDDEFRRMLMEAFAIARTQQNWPDVELREAPAGFDAAIRLTFANGDLTPQATEALSRLAGRPEIRIRIGNQHRVWAFGPEEQFLRDTVDAFPSLKAPARSQVSVVACPGARWCKRGLTDTNRFADRLRGEFAGKLPPGSDICISGCSNGCAHSAVAYIGLTGALTCRGGKKLQTWSLWADGQMGRTDKLARQILTKCTDDEAVKEIANLLD
jgi:sulfite reductase (ferredoxin)